MVLYKQICFANLDILHGDAIRESDLVELGNVIAGDAKGRVADEQITVADLTGVAVQDIQISKAVLLS